MNRCIWCTKRNSDRDIEHIFPEALGCPDGFYLESGMVCKKCNNGLAHLDRVVVGEFEIPAFMASVPRKKNKPPIINSFGNFKGNVHKSEKAFFINMDKNQHSIFPGGEKVAPFRGRHRDIKASINTVGNQASISFGFEIGKSKKFNRGIIKIAFSILAKAYGSIECNKDKYNQIRQFVNEGKGEIPFIMTKNQTKQYMTQSWNPYKSETGDYIVCFRLSQIDFLVDFTPDFSGFDAIRNKMKEVYGKNGFTWLPIKY